MLNVILKIHTFSVFVNNNQLPAQTVQNWPRRVFNTNQNFLTTPSPTTFPTLPPVTPKDIPEQLRLLGSNILADLIERADLTDALESRGPFTVFAPTDAAFEKLIDSRSDEYKNIILGDKTLLQYILLQHVTPDQLRSGDLSNGMRIQTLADNSLTVLNTRDGLTIGNVQLFVNLNFILYARWRFKIVCLQTKLASLAISKNLISIDF